MADDIASAPELFREALRSIAGAHVRRDVRVVEVPAPGRIAPYAAAISGEAVDPGIEASGRFVLLHDPDGNDAWDGTLRVVALVKAQVEAEVGADEMWADVAWAWLAEALEDLPHRERGGTVTKVVSRSFGELAERPDEVHVEVRVSWTPEDAEIGAHVTAWTELLASCAGLPPVPDGVAVLRGRQA